MTARNEARGQPAMSSLLRFFIPLGFAACMVSVTHFIINATLAQAAAPEIAIAAYAIGSSLFALTDGPAVLVRQTSSALVRDRLSFKAMSGLTWILILCTVAIGALISYTPVGIFIFHNAYGADMSFVPEIRLSYQF